MGTDRIRKKRIKGSIKVKLAQQIDIPISNTCLTKQLDQHMLQTVIRSIARACSYCQMFGYEGQ